MKPLVGHAAIFATVLLAGCGGAQPQPKEPTAPPASSGGPVVEAGGAPDLSPVAAPPDLIAFGRLANPGAAVDTVSSWAKFPFDVRGMIQKNEPELSRVLVFDAPMEFAVSLDPRGGNDVPHVFAVFSVGLASVEGAVAFARHEGQSVRMLRPGVYRVSSRSDGPSCAVASAVGKAPARLVCGDRDEDVDALLGYATRGLPNENMGNADLHIELRSEPWRRNYSRQMRQWRTLAAPFLLKEFSLDSPRFDRALADAVHGLADEILAVTDDIDRIDVDAWMKKDAGVVESKALVKFKGTGSWLVQTILDASQRGKGVPDSFWKLPKDSELGSYGSGANPKRYDAMRKTLGELIDGLLEHEKMPRKLRDQIGDLLQDTWTTEGAMVYAHGEVGGAPATTGGWQAFGQRARERIRSELGWYLVGLDDKPAKYKAYLDKAVKLYNDAQLRQMLDKRMHVKAAELPKLSVRGGRGLPPGSIVYEITLPSAFFGNMEIPVGPGVKAPKAAPVPPLPIVVVLVPDGDHTWIGVSADEKTLVQKINETKKPETTLASRDGLGVLKTAHGVSGGFFTLENFVKSVLSSLNEMGGAKNAAKVMSAMPHHGQTPMIAWTTVSKTGSTDLAWTVQIPRDVIEDIAAVAPALGAQAFGAGPPPVAPPPPPALPPRRPGGGFKKKK